MKDQVIQHSGRGHSELGPSSSERWLKCTPSAVLSAQFQDKPSVYAEEGTFLHELCELKLHKFLGGVRHKIVHGFVILAVQFAHHGGFVIGNRNTNIFAAVARTDFRNRRAELCAGKLFCRFGGQSYIIG